MRPCSLNLPARLLALGALSLVAFLASVAPAAAIWSDTAPLSANQYGGRTQAAVATLPGDKVLLAGGTSSISDLSSAQIYDSATDSWSAATDMGVFRSAPAGAELPGGKVLVAGGATFGTPVATAQIYDASGNSWADAAPMSTARTSAAGARLPGGKVLVAGGTDDSSNLLDSAEIYDSSGDAWSDAAPMPSVRYNAAAAELPDGKVLVVGGRDGGDDPLASAVIYDPATDAWSAVAPMGTPRNSPAAAVVIGSEVLVAGGYDASFEALGSAEIYDPGTDSWSAAEPMGTGRGGPQAAELPNGDVLVAGGHDAVGSLASTEKFDYPPTAVDDGYTIREDSGPVALSVRRNDTDPNGGPKQITDVTQASHGTVAIANGGANVTYTPDADYCNRNQSQPLDTFTYTLIGGSTATVSVFVRCVDDPPTAVDDSYSVHQDSGSHTLSVTRNDLNADGGPRFVTAAGDSDHGTVTVAARGKGVVYTPDAGYCNRHSSQPLDTFTYTLNGGSTATVSVLVRCT